MELTPPTLGAGVAVDTGGTGDQVDTGDARDPRDDDDGTAGLPTDPPIAPFEDGRVATAGSDRVIGGVCALLEQRLGVDALWLRIGFVVAGLAGGTGLLIYAALWLSLVVGERTTVFRWVGGIGLILVVPILMATSYDPRFATGPVAVVALLGGLALALWQPRRAHNRWSATDGSRLDEGYVGAGRLLRPIPAVRERSVRPPRETSLLGRAFLGLAVMVTAGGALVDQLNAGRLHPEQWLGAGAAVCGAGLLIGALRGRGRWLALPAMALAAAGFVAGEAARLGIGLDGLSDDTSVFVQEGQPGFTRIVSALNEDAWIQVDGAPTSLSTIDITLLTGDLVVNYRSDVSIEIRPVVERGRVTDGESGVFAERTAFRIGAEGDPDVIINAHLAYGDLFLGRFIQPVEPPVPGVDLVASQLSEIAPGLRIARDGTVVFGSGQLVLSATNEVLAVGPIAEGESNVFGVEVGDVLDDSRSFRPDGSLYVDTDYGQWRILPHDLAISPDGQVIDLAAARQDVTGAETIPSTPETPAPVAIDPAEPATTEGP